MDELQRVKEERDALRNALRRFMGYDHALQVGVGGNPHYVDRFLAEVRAMIGHSEAENEARIEAAGRQ